MVFSVILPIYNVEKYLRECVNSILSQTFNDYELILVDDGSTDSSGIICDEYSQRDERIKVIHKENGGLSDARNCGTEYAIGEYIVYIDSDDFVMSNDFLNDLNEKICVDGSDIILYKHTKFFDDTRKMSECAYSLGFINDELPTDEKLYELVKHDAYFGMAWIKAFKKTIIQKNDIKFEKGLLGEDMDWYFNLITHVNTISIIDKPYIAYRQRSGSITSSSKIKNLTDFIGILEKWSDKISTLPMSDKKRMALMGALAKYYSNLLITYARLNDRNKYEYRERIKKLSYLLDYGLSNRPLQMRKIYKIVGFQGVVIMLKIYDMIK